MGPFLKKRKISHTHCVFLFHKLNFKNKISNYITQDLELDGEVLKDMVDHESLLVDMIKSIGILRMKDRVFVMSKIKELVSTGKHGFNPQPM